jgi:hypothetical protein
MWSLGRQAVLLGYDHWFFVMATIATMAGNSVLLHILFAFLRYLIFHAVFIFLPYSISLQKILRWYLIFFYPMMKIEKFCKTSSLRRTRLEMMILFEFPLVFTFLFCTGNIM